MKVIIDVDENYIEDQVVIKCRELNENIVNLQKIINNTDNVNIKLELIKDGKEFFIGAEEILFFETDGEVVQAHTLDDMFTTKNRLYELEKILPWYFSRISKSAILNVKQVYAITKNLTASSMIEFKDSYKKVYVSRSYYKPLKSKINEMRNIK